MFFSSISTGHGSISSVFTTQTEDSSALETVNGVTTAEFVTKEGRIRVYLPEDMASGDRISGTVTTLPAGKNEKEKNKNLAKLEQNSIAIENVKSPVSIEIFSFEVPSAVPGDSLTLELLDRKDKLIQSISLPVVELYYETDSIEDIQNDDSKNYFYTVKNIADSEYAVPGIGQTGRPVSVGGAFDGDLSNTSLDIGGKPAKPIAESPRRTLFESPTDVIGMSKITLSEGNTTVTQDFRNIGVSLGAGKLNLLRGETTELQVRVVGLAELDENVPLNLQCTGSANMSGGNSQNLSISPDDVQPDGSFSQTRNLVGFRTGNFNVNANVQVNADPPNLNDQIVHVEKDPKDFTLDGENEKVWLVYVKTTDGKNTAVYFKGNKPKLKFCDWIKIRKAENDELERLTVKNFEPVDDPNQPCTLSNQTVHIEGNPLRMPDGRWRVKAKTIDGKTIYIRIPSPSKPDLKFCNWIKLHTCKKIGNSEFIVDGYDKTEDPTKEPPPTPQVTPPPTPTPVPKPTPIIRNPVVKKCPEGAVRRERPVTKEFELLEEESTISLSFSTDKGGTNDAANMAAWLRGLSKLGDLFGDDIPEGARAGAAVAAAAIKYLEIGSDILSALGKSGLKDKKVLEVNVSIYISTRKVTATCTSYEECVEGDWIPKKKYAETSKASEIRKEVKIDPGSNDWDKIANSGTYTLNPEKFEAYAKELLKKELAKLKKNAEDLEAFKGKCK